MSFVQPSPLNTLQLFEIAVELSIATRRVLESHRHLTTSITSPNFFVHLHHFEGNDCVRSTVDAIARAARLNRQSPSDFVQDLTLVTTENARTIVRKTEHDLIDGELSPHIRRAVTEATSLIETPLRALRTSIEQLLSHDQAFGPLLIEAAFQNFAHRETVAQKFVQAGNWPKLQRLDSLCQTFSETPPQSPLRIPQETIPSSPEAWENRLETWYRALITLFADG